VLKRNALKLASVEAPSAERRAPTAGPRGWLRRRDAVRALGVAAIIWTACPSAAHAQIYAWRDAAGNLVLSDKAKDPSARSYSLTPAGDFRSTKPLNPRAAQYDGLIREYSRTHAVSADLVRAVIQAESAFDPLARSIKGAMGLMQLMPGTAREFGVLDPYDPAENIRAGVAYLKRLLVRYGENVELALAAYNAGPTAVARYGRVPPYRETRNYVAKVRRSAEAAAAAHPRTHVYKVVEIIDGREVVRYTSAAHPGAERVKSAERR
jgi:soluble lytic murein transglycosylase-like protein